MGKPIVERLLDHLDENSGSFYRLWHMSGTTPTKAVADYRDIIEGANYDLEDDGFDLGNLIESIVADLDHDQVFEFGSGILHRKKQYRDKYS